jgi:hypothetical protein
MGTRLGGFPMSRWRVLGVLAMVGALLAPVVGCSLVDDGGGDGPASIEQIARDARGRGYIWQAELLEDGDITLAEFDEGYRRVFECVTEAGLTYDEPYRDVVDGFRWEYTVYWYGMEDEVGSRLYHDCYDRYVGDLELAMSSWGDWVTEPALMAEIEECVLRDDINYERGVAKNYRDLFHATADQGVTKMMMTACIESAMERLYPDRGYGIAY